MTTRRPLSEGAFRPAATVPQDSRLLTAWSLSPARSLVLIVGLFTILGVVYSLVTPVLEASDEFKHYPYVQYVQTAHELPVLEPNVCRDTPEACPWLQDGGQPPAYYVLTAAATSWIDTTDLPGLLWKNDHAFIGNPAQVCNKNLVIHRPRRESFPWTGSVLAIHLIRLLTLSFGAGTVLLTYLVTQSLVPDRPGLALGASALTAFNPMFLFVSSSVNNDAMAAFIGSVSLLAMVRIARGERYDAEPQLLRQSLGLGLLVGLGVLTKLSLLALIPLASLIMLIRGWQTYAGARRRRQVAAAMLYPSLVVLAAVAVSGWWFVRNWRVYGDPTALNAFIAIQGRRAHAPTLGNWIGEFGTFRWTYWGLFGGVNVMAPRPIYWFFDFLSLAGLLGFGTWVVRQWRQSRLTFDYRLLIPLVWASALFVSVLRWSWIYPSFQGRLVFPGVAGISFLIMTGLGEWAPRGFRSVVTAGTVTVLFVIAAVLPLISIRPAYAHPEPLTPSDLPENARVEPVDIGTAARVVGVTLSPQAVAPDDKNASVDVVVYWEAQAPDGRDYISFARLLGRDHRLVGHVNRHPACGMVPTSLWEPGQIWRDPYRIPVAEGAEAPSRLRVEVGLYDSANRETLGAMRVGETKLAPPKSVPDPDQQLAVKFADGIALRGYDLEPAAPTAGQTLTVTLHWAAQKAPSADYQVFVHLLGEANQLLAQGDGPPLMGDYPTSLWTEGEIIADPHRIDLPADLSAGDYRVLVGMYDLETMDRLPCAGGDESGVDIRLSIGGE